jgi:hypothetical protein
MFGESIANKFDRELLEIPKNRFMAVDLERPFQLKRKFDLVVSLEVAEHLPAHCAEDFVSTLTGLGSVVLFSAAAPHQGGEHHVNEQSPDYWAELFQRRKYVPVDCLRKKFGRTQMWNGGMRRTFSCSSRLSICRLSLA